MHLKLFCPSAVFFIETKICLIVITTAGSNVLESGENLQENKTFFHCFFSFHVI